jgi:hypothetical protein
LVVDGHWNIVVANRGLAYATRGVAPELLAPPANALRIALSPLGLALRISNLAVWSSYLLSRLRRDIEAASDADLEALYDELIGYPGVTAEDDRAYAQNPTGTLLMHELYLDEAGRGGFRTWSWC